MTAIFEFPLSSETLSSAEVAEITGATRSGAQIEWLIGNGWTYHTNRGGAPIVGRMYARLRLAGITPAALATSGGWVPDFSGLR
jgi:hypothetical protein